MGNLSKNFDLLELLGLDFGVCYAQDRETERWGSMLYIMRPSRGKAVLHV